MRQSVLDLARLFGMFERGKGNYARCGFCYFTKSGVFMWTVYTGVCDFFLFLDWIVVSLLFCRVPLAGGE